MTLALAIARASLKIRVQFREMSIKYSGALRTGSLNTVVHYYYLRSRSLSHAHRLKYSGALLLPTLALAIARASLKIQRRTTTTYARARYRSRIAKNTLRGPVRSRWGRGSARTCAEERRSQVDAVDSKGYTALMHAAMRGMAVSVEVLLHRGLVGLV